MFKLSYATINLTQITKIVYDMHAYNLNEIKGIQTTYNLNSKNNM